VIDPPGYHTSTSGTPGLTPRFLRIAPLVTDAATGSVAVQNVQAGSSHLSRSRASFTCSRHSSRRATARLARFARIRGFGFFRLAEQAGLFGFR
jgi:hypothetical protein